jgi:tetratricopeptide (TPR) repeat protein
MMKHTLGILVMLCATARASVWDRALTTPEAAAAKELYDIKMIEGDTATLTATIQSASARTVLESIRRAEAAYRAAAAARPDEAEPYFRIGQLLHQMYFDCDQSYFALRPPVTCQGNYATPARREATIEAWNEFERRAPLDPRIDEILVKRAILSTKAVNGTHTDREHLEAAARDYQAALDRNDGLSTVGGGNEQMLGNLAETYMMLDRLDDAIATYRRAVAIGAARVSTVYGLAVATDRDGSGELAFRYIQGQGTSGLDAFHKDYASNSVFFVPEGEAFYYFALAKEAFGEDSDALEYWQRYVKSGAHPEFQPRAQEHIDELRKRHVRPDSHASDPDEPGR